MSKAQPEIKPYDENSPREMVHNAAMKRRFYARQDPMSYRPATFVLGDVVVRERLPGYLTRPRCALSPGRPAARRVSASKSARAPDDPGEPAPAQRPPRRIDAVGVRSTLGRKKKGAFRVAT